MPFPKKIRVLIVDDSAVARQTMAEVIESDPDLEVMATASDAYFAAEHIRREIPDVIFLDLEMPRMDGLTFMRKIMAQRPIPVVICSSLTEFGSDTLMQVLEAGAVDVVTKPRVQTQQFLQESRMRICDAAKAAAQARLRRAAPVVPVETKHSADVILPPVRIRPDATPRPGDRIVCIGASTGGTEALRVVLQGLPEDCPGIVIVQHMPEKFTGAFARRLDGICAPEIKEAEDGDKVLRGRVLIAPGNHHVVLRRCGMGYDITINDGPPVCRHRPSVDVLFRSAAQAAGANAMGVILTGMGDDGARGLTEMRRTGSLTIAQNEDTCVVFGMPNEAIKLGGAEKVLPLGSIAREIMDYHNGMRKARAGAL